MRKSTKIWLIIATSLVVLGFIMFSVLMTVNNWDFTKLNTVKYETNTYQISEEFSSISMNTDTADILFLPSDEGMCKVVCYEMSNMKHAATVQNDTLTINVVNEKEWYDYIGITFGTPKITVYLPETEYDSLLIKEDTGDIEIPKSFKFESIDISISTGDVTNYASASEVITIKTSTGNVNVSNVICEGNIVVNVSTGKVSLSDIKCKNLISDGSTGDISLKNVIATEKFSIERSTGDVKFDSCDANEIWVKTDTGDVTGNLLSEKIFITQTSTGDINVPKSTTGGKCEVTTSTGDINIK